MRCKYSIFFIINDFVSINKAKCALNNDTNLNYSGFSVFCVSIFLSVIFYVNMGAISEFNILLLSILGFSGLCNRIPAFISLIFVIE